MIGLGIDTGGTCTDAVIYDLAQNTVLASAKTPTTKEDLKTGIRNVLDRLPQDLLNSCQTLALSTTLATNACVEGKWGNGKLILIGLDRNTFESSWHKYGIPASDDIYLLECRLTPSPDNCAEPDWDAFRKDMKEFVRGCDCVSIVQLFAREYHGQHEQHAADIVREITDIPVILGHHLFPDRNILRRGTGALLNARLIPVIYEFLRAVRRVLEEFRLDLPLLIMRSDGHLMSSDYTALHPVETLLCGPAASTMGALSMTGEKRAVVVDMGGTTTDISIIRDGEPLRIEGGIQIAEWKTFVRGLYVDTFALGGDTEVLFDSSGTAVLGTQRILPLAMLGAVYPSVKNQLMELDKYSSPYPVPVHEFFLLLKEPGPDAGLNDIEYRICGALKNGPLSRENLAAAISRDIYTMKTERLEQAGYILRSGITPTDIMHIKGDFSEYDRSASLLGAEFMARSLRLTVDELCETVYTLVQKRLYCNLVRILLDTEYSLFQGNTPSEQIRQLIEKSFESARKGERNSFSAGFFSDAVLIGIGAPVHLFLEPVAHMLHTKAVIPKYAPVANAIGAVVGNVSASVTAQIRPDPISAENFQVITQDSSAVFNDYDESVAYAKEQIEKAAEELLIQKGGRPPFSTVFSQKREEAPVDGSILFLSENITVTKTGKAF